MHCKFCFATYDSISAQDTRSGLSLKQSMSLIELLGAAGFQKITFAGGEPTLCPWLSDLIAFSADTGLRTGLVTNGSRLRSRRHSGLLRNLDWLVISVDSLSPDVNRRHGRAVAGLRAVDPKIVISAADHRGKHVRLKINTVVTQLNANEILLPFIQRVRPQRWKIMQVLPIRGENDVGYGHLSVSPAEFRRFIDRNSPPPIGTTLVTEDNDDMTGSYVMIDPAGRLISNITGAYEVSRPILVVGVTSAMTDISYDSERFRQRGGFYDW